AVLPRPAGAGPRFILSQFPSRHPRGEPLPASTILVLETAATGDASLAPILTNAGATVPQPSAPAEAIAQVVEHQLVAIDVGSGIAGQTGFELCHQVRATPTKVSIPILCVAATDDVEERISFL